MIMQSLKEFSTLQCDTHPNLDIESRIKILQVMYLAHMKKNGIITDNVYILQWCLNTNQCYLKGYELQYMKSHEGGSHSQTNFMTYGILGGTTTDFKIEPYSDYHFRVRVVTNDGYNGAWSQEYHTLSSGTVH